ncbi:MAG: ADP-ribosylglycohydrolase family protein [Chthoniobacter sp.]
MPWASARTGTYDLDELRRDYGPWITGYTEPQPDRYHAGLKAGALSQAGIILVMLLRSVVERGDYDEADFCRRLDDDLFPQLDGTPMNGPGGYTSQSIREAWRRRVKEGASWRETAGHADTTEAIERALVLGARYATNPRRLAETVSANCHLTQGDEAIVAMTTAFCCVLGQLVAGEPFDELLSDKLMGLVKSGDLPFHAVTADALHAPPPWTGTAQRRTLLLARRPAHALLHGRSRCRPRHPDRARMESLHRLRHALRRLPPTPRRLLPRRAIPR